MSDARAYRKLGQAAERAVELEEERWALREVLERIRADARSTETRAVSLERECGVLQATLDREAVRDLQIEQEISDLDRQAAALRLQTAATARRFDALAHEAQSLERSLQDEQRNVTTAQTRLGGAIERVTRLDYKLRFSPGTGSLPRR
jgi:chromosome segregation ATPase